MQTLVKVKAEELVVEKEEPVANKLTYKRT